MTRIAFSCDVRITDRQDLAAFVTELGKKADGPAARVFAATVNPSAKRGYRLVSEECRAVAKGTPAADAYQVVVVAEITDAAAVVEDARECYVENWGDSAWSPATLAEALYETLIASNASPAPCQIGISLGDWAAIQDMPAPKPDNAEDDAAHDGDIPAP